MTTHMATITHSANDEQQTLDATACLLTGSQRAAVATIALQGRDSQAALQHFFTANSSRPFYANELRYGQWCSASSQAEHVVVVQVDDTADNACDIAALTAGRKWEIHCHGGALAADRILSDLASIQVSVVEPRVFAAAQQSCLLLRETDDVIGRTLTVRTARHALQQRKHGLNEFVTHALRRPLLDDWEAIRSEAKRIQRFRNFGLHLTQPWRIVLAGLPNVGKSSLMNALVGFERSITYDLPGTTRDVVTCDGAIDGWPVLFSDTAGIREQASDDIEQQGIERAKAAIAQADLVVMVHDATMPNEPFPVPLPADKRCLTVINKIDRVAETPLNVEPDTLFTSTVSGVA